MDFSDVSVRSLFEETHRNVIFFFLKKQFSPDSALLVMYAKLPLTSKLTDELSSCSVSLLKVERAY